MASGLSNNRAGLRARSPNEREKKMSDDSVFNCDRREAYEPRIGEADIRFKEMNRIIDEYAYLNRVDLSRLREWVKENWQRKNVLNALKKWWEYMAGGTWEEYADEGFIEDLLKISGGKRLDQLLRERPKKNGVKS